MPTTSETSEFLTAEEHEGADIGRYKLIKILGEGGFGTVWRAEQLEPLRRAVALKIIKLGMNTRQVVARFEAERQALALMDHPNIARVFDGGTTANGRPFFVMELVTGLPITGYCNQHQLDTRKRLKLFIQVCQAVQHAHQKGVIHRDIKPSNILVSEHDGTPLPKVIDFGVAKAIDEPLTEKTLFTRFHQVIGTPAYMSPEQAGLGGLDIDTRTDIYSLGALLYELLTGEPILNTHDLAKHGVEAVLRCVREAEPVRPSTRLATLSPDKRVALAARLSESPQNLSRLFRADLDWIILKAVAKDRSLRYETVNGLAADLQRYLSNEPVTAAPPTVAYQLRTFARKHRTAIATAVCLALMLVAGIVATSWQAIRASRSAKSEAEQRAEKGRLLYAAEMGLAFQAWEDGLAPQARRLLEQQRPQRGEPDLRGWEWRHLWEKSRPQELAIVTNTNLQGQIAGITWSRDGSRLALGYNQGGVQVWDAHKKELLRERWFPSSSADVIDMIAFTLDGSHLYVSTRNTNFYLLDATTLATTATFAGHTQGVYSLALTRDGTRLATCAGDPYGQEGSAELFVWDTARREVLFKLPPHDSVGANPDFSSSGRYLAVAFSSSGRVGVWDIIEQREAIGFSATRGRVWRAVFSPDETLLATSGEDGYIRLWNWRTGSEIATLGAHRAPAPWVEFSSDGSRLVSAGLDSTVRTWDVPELRERMTFRGHMGRLHRARFSPDGHSIVSGCSDFTLRFWDAHALESDRIVSRFPQTRSHAAFSSDGKHIVIAWGGGRVTPKLCVLPRHAAETTERKGTTLDVLFASPLSTFVGTNLAVMSSTEIYLYGLPNGKVARKLQSPWALASAIAASRDGHFVASAAREGTNNHVLVWNANTGVLERDLITGTSPITPGLSTSPQLVFSADGTQLWTTEPGGKDVLAYGWRSNQLLAVMPGHTSGILCAALAPDGKLLVTGGLDQIAWIWNAKNHKPVAKLHGETGHVSSLGFSPDGQTLAMGCFDGWVRLWNFPTRVPMATLRSHISVVYTVAFSPDGRDLLTTSYDGTARLWSASPMTNASK